MQSRIKEDHNKLEALKEYGRVHGMEIRVHSSGILILSGLLRRRIVKGHFMALGDS